MLQTFGEVAWILELQKQPEHTVARVYWDVSGAQDVGTPALTSCCHAGLWSVPTMLTPARLLSASLCRQPACCLGNTSSTAARSCSTLPTGSRPHGTPLCRAATGAGGPLPWAKEGGGFAHHIAGQQNLLWPSHRGMRGSHGDPTVKHGCRWPWSMFWVMVELHSWQGEWELLLERGTEVHQGWSFPSARWSHPSCGPCSWRCGVLSCFLFLPPCLQG